MVPSPPFPPRCGPAVAALCAVVLGTPLPVAGQQGMGARDADVGAVAERVSREILSPVIESLLEQLQGDRQLSGLVSAVALYTYPTPRPHLGRNAAATRSLGRPVVQVDLEFLAELMQIASLGGAGLTRTAAGDSLITSTLREWNRQLGEAARGMPMPDFEANLDQLGDAGSALRDVATRLGVEVGLTTAAWLVLHEIGHHVLGHLEVEPPSLERSRQLEESADAWAYGKLHELGYHLYYLDVFLEAREVLEELALHHGLATPEAESDHPLYATRRIRLNALHDVGQPAPVRMLAFLGVGWDDQGRPQLIEAWVPRYPDEDIQPDATLWTGSQVGNSVLDWVDGEVHIYGRSPGLLTRVTIHDPAAMRSKVTITYRWPESGKQQAVERFWIQTTLAWARSRRAGNLRVATVLDAPVLTVLRESLSAAGVDSATSQAAVGEFKDFFASFRKALVRYASGEISLEAAAGIMESRSAEFSSRFHGILGPAWTAALEEQWLQNSTVAAMEEVLLKGRPPDGS